MYIEYFEIKDLFGNRLAILRKTPYDFKKNQGVSVTNQALLAETRRLLTETP